MGNLTGISGASAGEYGLYAGSGSIATTAQYIRVSTAGVQLNNVPIVIYNGGSEAVRVTPTEGIRVQAGSATQNQIDVYSGSDKVYAQWTQLDSTFNNTETHFESWGKPGLGMGTLTLRAQSSDGVDSAYLSIGSTYVNIGGKPLTIFDGATINDGLTISAGDIDMDGNTIHGNTTSGGTLTLSSTSHATKGIIAFTGTLGEAWISASYNTGWGSYGGGYHGAEYKKVGDIVFLRGMVVRSSGSATTIFTLPSGYRPTNSMVFSQIANDAVARVAVDASGNVVLQVGAVSPWVNLTGVAFSTV